MKHRFCVAAVLTLLGFLFIPISGNCQETTPASATSSNAGLPNAPSTTQATTCTQNNGKPCPDWLQKVIGQYPPPPESVEVQRNPSSVHFWTLRGSQDPPLRTNKQVFRSKAFLAAHIGGAIAMIVACRTKNSGEDWASEVPAVAGLFGMDYIQYRFISGPTAVGPAVYEMIHYGLASAR